MWLQSLHMGELIWLEYIYLTHTLQGDKGAHVHCWIIWVTWPNVEATGKDIGDLFVWTLHYIRTRGDEIHEEHNPLLH